MELTKLLSLILLLLLSTTVRVSKSENILFLLPLATRSHRNIISPLISALADKGHTVTLVLPDKGHQNVREIIPTNFSSKMDEFGDPLKRRSESSTIFFYKLFHLIVEGCHEAYQNPEFMNLLNEKFDLIFITSFLNDCFDGFVYKLKAPFIILTTTAAPAYITAITGNRLQPSFTPVPVLDYTDDMNFKERVTNLIVSAITDFVPAFLCQPEFQRIYKKYLGEDCPDLHSILKSTSMIFMNSHFVISYPRTTLPDVIEIGGMHCHPAKPLPTDLEEFIHGAEDGFIYFSLGSLIQAKSMPNNIRQIFLTVFSRLSQKVIWKWEEDNMENVPKNVKLVKWLPQQDILGHPKIKLFLTHGGLLSIEEAIYHGVPLIGIPLFADQNWNLRRAEKAGFSLNLEFLELTEEKLETTVKKILGDNQFARKAKEYSTLFRDQLETPLERALFWTEYVMRRKGRMSHMRSASRDLNFIQYYSLDTISFLILITAICMWLCKIIIVAVVSRLFHRKGGKLKGQ